MTEPHARSDLIGLLAWYGEMGADAVLAEDAINWLDRGDTAPGAEMRAALRASLQQGAAPAAGSAPTSARQGSTAARPSPPSERPFAAPPAARPPPQAPAPSPPLPSSARAPATARPSSAGPAGLAPDASLTEARRLAGGATTLADLKAALEAFSGCPLKATAKNTCVYRGAERARLMIVGEAPGREEDLEGRPFVGRAGQLLDRMLKAAALSEADVHITNAVYWRPPGNRTPTPQEIETLKPFLERQVEIVAPEFVLALGGVAGKAVLAIADGIMRMRGKWRQITLGTHEVRAIATLHPAYLLRTPEAKRLVWRDMIAVRQALDGSALDGTA